MKTKEKKERAEPTAVIPVRVPKDIQERVRGVANHQDISDAAVFRMALKKGLPLLESMFGIKNS